MCGRNGRWRETCRRRRPGSPRHSIACGGGQQRQGQREPLEAIADTAATQASPLERLDQQQRLRQLARALEGLPPRRREALILHRFEGLSQSQVAERMGISLSMVEKHIAAALLHCRQQLTPDTGKDEQ